ncbi:MAG: hypothetical protein ACI8UO_000170 [Verrucomicrobiales bacterium]|jgi:hypothetical protein
MIRFTYLTAALGLALVFCTAAAGQTQVHALGAAEYREFTSASGSVIRARLIKVDGEDVILRVSATGKDTPVPLAKLSEADQAYVKAWDPDERLPKPEPTAEPVAKPLLDPKLAETLLPKGFAAVKLRQEGRAILMDVVIDGEEFEFAVDTGQLLTMMDNSTARKLGITPNADVEYATYNLADGTVEKVLAADIEAIDIGEVKITKIPLGVANLKKIGFADVAGIFGADILSYFNGVVDWQSLTLFLNKSDSD